MAKLCTLLALTLVAFAAAATKCGSGQSACGSACYNPSSYACTTDNKGATVLCPKTSPQACNGGCYDPSKYICTGAGGLAANTVTQSASAAKAATTSAAAAATKAATTSAAAATKAATSSAAPATTAAVNNNPTPAPVNYPTQTADLRIINSCKKTLWFEARYGGAGAPIPGQSTTATQALPGSYVDYTVPSTGLSGSRFWAKYGCDTNGKNCLIGDQMQYWPNPPGGCPAKGCTPPVDSLFEATWGCKPGASCNAGNPTTWFDTSQVDGWTIPYKMTASGATNQCDCTGTGCGFSGVDATNLLLSNCPTGEDLSVGGTYPSVIAADGSTVNLNSVDLRIINNATREVIGCMSPCKKLNWGAPYGLQQPETSGATMWMCCPTPTPDSCSPNNGCITSAACRAGPIENTKFVDAVHKNAPGVYSYSYDDGVGLHACPAGTVVYTMEFCPNGTSYPLQL